jgi:hypothetical protein
MRCGLHDRWAQALDLMRLTTLTLLLLMASGCDGGGVAGAGRDPDQGKIEADNYPGYVSPRLSENVLQNQCNGQTFAGLSQHFEDTLRSFAFHLEMVGQTPIELANYGLQASFKNHELLVKKNDEVLIKQTLPSVFAAEPMLGIDEMGGLKVIMVADRSRSTTGRYFVAIYSLDGTPLYKKVLKAWQVWDIDKDARHIDILGCSETRRISMN